MADLTPPAYHATAPSTPVGSARRPGGAVRTRGGLPALVACLLLVAWALVARAAAAQEGLTGPANAPGALPGAGAHRDDPGETRRQEAPRLAVLLVVDQLRADLLDRYADVFTGGLARLREGGFHFRHTTHDHAITLTAPGHATLSTGTLPWKHGVVANAWFKQDGGSWQAVENVLDPSRPLVHDASLVGASPRVLERDGLGDWLAAAHPDARTVSVSAKARAAVLMGPRSGGLAVWFDEVDGRFVTSTHYAEAEPDWLADFNRAVLPTMGGDWVWRLEVPVRYRPLARPDPAPYEGDGVHTTFPHRYEDHAYLVDQGQPWVWWATTPELDRATRLLAQRAAEEAELGADSVPDLLAISLSQTDRVGHAYGPLSLEQLDNLYRLDREVGALLDWLDQRYGRQGYVLALTADHGVADNPEAVRARGGEALRVSRDSALVLQQRLNEVAAQVGAAGARDLPEALVRTLPEISWVAQAWSTGSLAELREATRSGAPPPDSMALFQARSHFPGRYTGLLARQEVELRLTPNTLTWAYPRGTTHGSPYLYDRQVPFILLGGGIPAGATDRRASTTDVAPTLARILGIPFPRDLDGVARIPADEEGGGG